MDWNKKTLESLGKAICERWMKFKSEKNTDRKNLSELWNLHLKSLGISVVRPKGSKSAVAMGWQGQAFVEIINLRNEEVAGAVCVWNPDRDRQYLLVPRDIAGKILTLGMP